MTEEDIELITRSENTKKQTNNKEEIIGRKLTEDCDWETTYP